MRLQHQSLPPLKASAGPGSQQLKKDILAHATRLHQAGRLEEAEQIYRQILALDPEHADSLHLLGVIATQTGQFDAAIGLITRAIQVSRHNPFFHGNLATALKARGRVDEAVQHYKRAIILKPDYADAHSNLGNVLVEQRRYEEAIAHFRQALAIHP